MDITRILGKKAARKGGLKKKLPPLAALCFLLWGCPGARAQQAYTLSRLEKALLRENLSLKAASHRLQAARYAREEAGLYLPRLHLGLNAYPSGYVDLVRKKDKITLYNTVSLRFPLLEGMVGRHYDAMEKETVMEERAARMEGVSEEVLFALRLNYLEAITNRKAKEIYRRGVESLSELLRTMGHYHRQKRILPGEVLFAEKQQLELKQGEREREHALLRNRIVLAALLNIRERDLLLPSDFSCTLNTPLPPLEKLTAAALERSPRLKELEARHKRERYRFGKTFWEGLRLNLVTGYSIEHEFSYGYEQGAFVGLDFTCPLNFEKAGLKRRLASQQRQSYAYEIKEARREVEDRLRLLYEKTGLRRSQLRLLEKKLEEARARRRRLTVSRDLSVRDLPDFKALAAAEKDFWRVKAGLEEKKCRRIIELYRLAAVAGETKEICRCE